MYISVYGDINNYESNYRTFAYIYALYVGENVDKFKYI